MNLMARNILDIEYENNRVKKEASLEHYIFTWKISNISFCFSGSDFFLNSPQFVLADGHKWELKLNVDNSEDKYNIYTYLCQLETGSKPKKVKFSLRLQILNECLWSSKNRLFPVTRDQSVNGDFLEINKNNLHDILLCGIRSDDVLTVTCEMMVVYVEEISKNAINFYTDIEDLSEDIMKLLQNGLCPNIDLVVRGDDYTNICVYIKAHKEILSSWSSKFARSIGPDTHSLRILNYTYDVVKAMLVFLYSGDISKLAAEDPPPPELWKCAQEYGIAELSKHLRPQELVSNTEIEIKTDTHRWDLQNFLTLRTARNTIEESVVLLRLGNVQVKMILFFVQNAPISFRIEVTNATHLGIILIDVEIIYAYLNIRRQMWQIQQMDNSGKCTFVFPLNLLFLHEDIRPPHDNLFIQCNFKSALRNPTSRNDVPMVLAESVSKVFDENALSKKMRKLLKAHWYSDINFGAVGDDDYIGVHRSVLNARCPLFVRKLEDIIEGNSRPELSYSLKSVKRLLRYLYTGTLKVTWSLRTLIDLHEIACECQIPHLRNNCVMMLETRVSRFNACRICSFAKEYRYEKLKNLCFQCIFQYECGILNSHNWSRFISENDSLRREIDQYISNRKMRGFYNLYIV